MKSYLVKFSLPAIVFLLAVNTANASMMPMGDNYDEGVFIYKYDKDENDLPPKANIRIRNNTGNVETLAGTTATEFTFDGNGSTDAETSPYQLEVRYDFENDGKVDTYFSRTKTATHVYSTTGIKTVKMEVLDLAGNVSTGFARVLIVENTPPHAYFEVMPKVGTPGTEFYFNHMLSSDDQYDNNTLEYRYDFEGDGFWDTKFMKMKSVKYQFTYPGLKNAVLEVSDPEGSSAFYHQTIYVNPNKSPTAEFEITRNNKGNILVDASKSSDPDVSKLQYRWDFDYNGINDIQNDTPWNSSPIASHMYKKQGEYLIRLMVKDEDETIAIIIMNTIIDLLS